jgi:hypothetical protein
MKKEGNMANVNLHIVFEKSKSKNNLEFLENKTERVNSAIITVYNNEELYNKLKYLERDFILPLLTKIYSFENPLFFSKLKHIYSSDERTINKDPNLEIEGTEKAKYKLDKFFESSKIYDYLNKATRIDRQKTIEIIKYFNANELLNFLQTIRVNSEITTSRKITNIANDIKNHKFIKTTVDSSQKIYDKPQIEIVCQQTYGGFLRALKTNTLYHITAEIDGRPKALFVKTQIGELPSLKQYSREVLVLGGYNVLAIDPETLNVYSFRTLNNGRVDSKSLKLVMDYKNIESYLKIDRKYLAQEAKKLAQEFKKELHRKLDKMYRKENIPGTQRIKKTYERFRAKPK